MELAGQLQGDQRVEPPQGAQLVLDGVAHGLDRVVDRGGPDQDPPEGREPGQELDAVPGGNRRTRRCRRVRVALARIRRRTGTVICGGPARLA